jgi:hypothetical protein
MSARRRDARSPLLEQERPVQRDEGVEGFDHAFEQRHHLAGQTGRLFARLAERDEPLLLYVHLALEPRVVACEPADLAAQLAVLRGQRARLCGELLDGFLRLLRLARGGRAGVQHLVEHLGARQRRATGEEQHGQRAAHRAVGVGGHARRMLSRVSGDSRRGTRGACSRLRYYIEGPQGRQRGPSTRSSVRNR